MSARLKYVLRSLINATLVLAIILTGLGLLLLNKVESFAADVISDVKFGLLQEIDGEVKDVAASIRTAERDLRVIASRLGKIIERPAITLSLAIQQDLRSLGAEVEALRQSVTQLTSSHEALSDDAIRKIASTIADTYIEIRQCRRQRVSHTESRKRRQQSGRFRVSPTMHVSCADRRPQIIGPQPPSEPQRDCDCYQGWTGRSVASCRQNRDFSGSRDPTATCSFRGRMFRILWPSARSGGDCA